MTYIKLNNVTICLYLTTLVLSNCKFLKQIENEFGSYGDDKAYLHYLVKLARGHLGDDIIL